jgi:hypothetical protein
MALDTQEMEEGQTQVIRKFISNHGACKKGEMLSQSPFLRHAR